MKLYSLHGMMGNAQDLSFLDTLDGVDHYPLELPGHGEQALPPPEASSWSAITCQYANFIEKHAAGENFLLYGYSMGGRVMGSVAKELALKGIKAHGLILESSHFGNLTLSEREERFRRDLLLFNFPATKEQLESFLRNWWSAPLFGQIAKSPYFKDFLEKKVKEGLLKKDGWAKSLEILSVAKQEDYYKFYQENETLNLLYLVGQDDRKYLEISAGLIDSPNTQVKSFKAGHNVHFTLHLDINKTIKDWLTNLQA